MGIFLLFIAGLGLAFTPCILPMLPIVANIVAHDHKHSAKHGFILSSAYGVGVSVAYGMLGIIVAIFGRQYVIPAMQSNPVLIVSAGVFVVLALYMLGVINIRLPFAVSQKIHQISEKGQGNLGNVFGSLGAGFFSAIVVSPCMTAPLVGALIGVASVGDPVFGFVALFMFGMGLSTPLIIVGTTGSSVLPNSGDWLEWVKQGFALLLFAVAILLLDRVFDSPWELLLWAGLATIFALWFFKYKNKGKQCAQLLGIFMVVWAVLLVVGAFMGNYNPLNPLQKPAEVSQKTSQKTQHKPLIKAYDIATINTITQENSLVVVDVWASWCIECKIMDKKLFAEKPEALHDWQLVKLDISEVNDQSKAVMESLNLFGPPALVFYKDGKLLGVEHGETKRERFIEMLETINTK